MRDVPGVEPAVGEPTCDWVAPSTEEEPACGVDPAEKEPDSRVEPEEEGMERVIKQIDTMHVGRYIILSFCTST